MQLAAIHLWSAQSFGVAGEDLLDLYVEKQLDMASYYVRQELHFLFHVNSSVYARIPPV